MLIDKLVQWFSRSVADQGINEIYEIPLVLSTDKGLKRSENQDRVAAMRVNHSQSNKPFIVIALADGMGGMRNGSLCASHAIGSFFYYLIHLRKKAPKQKLELSALAANKHVYDLTKGTGGATLSAILIETNHSPLYLNVGDSRIYAASENMEIKRITTDDSLKEAVGGYGRELLQFIGMGDGLKPHIGTIPKNIEKLYLTTDGIHFIDQTTFYDVLLKAPDLIQTVKRINNIVHWCGAPDNASIAVASLPKMKKSLSEKIEIGTDFWDSFGALNIMWLNEKEKAAMEKASSFINQIKSERFDKNHMKNKNNTLPSKTKEKKKNGTKKSRGDRSDKEKFKYSDDNQLIIDIKQEDKNETPK
jgi:serine/threonine protein phosphatase PrpC